MSGRKCEAICKTGKDKQCVNTAVYFLPGKGFRCGSHMKDFVGNKEEYSIKRMGYVAVTQRIEQEDIVVYENGGGHFSGLSNLSEGTFEHRGIVWRSAENALQGLSFLWECSNPEKTNQRLKLVRQIASVSPIEARNISEKFLGLRRKDWVAKSDEKYTVRDRYLLEILIAKFKQYEELQQLLTSTEDAKIVVHGTEDDKLGDILMLTRNYFRKQRLMS
jgi:predicted NAD-dependent protein-ADP-ribosyltransferase YbiA (DUF1768 family)